VTRVAIVGGGIAGLAAAFDVVAAEPGVDAVLFEAGERVGGNLRSEEVDGFRVEWAANGFLDSDPATIRLAERLGLSGRLLPADGASARRYLFRGGRLHLLPASPRAFFASRVLSVRGRLRVLAEPFARAAPRGADESVFDFAARRIGGEAARTLVDALVSGLFAGDARALSVASAFPKMRAMEAQHGSFARAMIARRRGAARGGSRGGPAGPGGRLVSFAAGMEELPAALAARLGGRIRLGAPVTAWAPPDRSGGRHRLRLASGDANEWDAVLLACPPSAAARIVAASDGALAAHLAAIPSAPIAMIALGYRLADVRASLDGFGFLVPRSEGVRPLGAVFDSNLFPGRAPSERALVRVLAGGACDPSAVDLSDDALVALARSLLRAAVGIDADPVLTRVVRHRLGIPQYVVGHGARLEAIAQRLAAHPGLFVSGSGYRGVSVNACVAEAPVVAAALLRRST